MSLLSIDSQPLHSRPFLGLGVQADAYIFNEVNKTCGVNEEDHQLIANRLRHLRPSLVRMFVELSWFAQDNETGAVPSTMVSAFLRQLRLVGEAGALVNVVLFRPMPWDTLDLEPAVRRMMEVLVDLVKKEGCSHIRWLTLWNEPDNLFGHGSALSERLFGKTPSTWPEYVRLNRLAYHLLDESGLSDSVKLIVADAVWGPLMRRERMELAFEAFHDLNVAYSIHSYSHEKEIGNQANPDFLYQGIEDEVRRYRDMLGPDRELALWEFNTSGVQGFGTFFAGVGPHGEERIGSIEGGAEVADKVISGMAGGLDGCALWCLHDMRYETMETCPMEFGLWRYKWHKWYPRPIYHYYGALMAAFRPGARIHGVRHEVPGLKALAAKYQDGEVLALLNTGGRPLEIPLALAPGARLLRIGPSRLPAVCDLPLHLTSVPTPLEKDSPLVLEACELSLVLWGRKSDFPDDELG